MSVATRPRLKAPPNSCDTHMHIYDSRFPQAPGGPKPPGDFPVEAYRRMQARLGVSRVVVVQPNAYRDDNRCTLDAIAGLGAGAKGVGVVKPGATDAHLAELTRGGIRGIRFMTLPGGALGWDVMDALAARVHAFGWHAVVQLDGRTLPERETQIRRLRKARIVDMDVRVARVRGRREPRAGFAHFLFLAAFVFRARAFGLCGFTGARVGSPPSSASTKVPPW